MDEQHERLDPVDCYNGNALTVKLLELGVPVDRDLFKPERNLLANLLEHAPRTLAQVSSCTRVDDNVRLITATVRVASQYDQQSSKLAQAADGCAALQRA